GQYFEIPTARIWRSEAHERSKRDPSGLLPSLAYTPAIGDESRLAVCALAAATAAASSYVVWPHCRRPGRRPLAAAGAHGLCRSCTFCAPTAPRPDARSG